VCGVGVGVGVGTRITVIGAVVPVMVLVTVSVAVTVWVPPELKSTANVPTPLVSVAVCRKLRGGVAAR
jgi:hypothetical protein